VAGGNQCRIDDAGVLEHARLIDGTGAPPREDMRIVVRGDRIVSVQPEREAARRLRRTAIGSTSPGEWSCPA